MLARQPAPPEYDRWNQEHGSPNGTAIGRALRYGMPRFLPVQPWAVRHFGQFSFQKNNDTRAWEYPWIAEQIGDPAGLRILDIGGSLAGMQFVMANQGALVSNLDPGLKSEGRGWKVDSRSLENMADATGTNISLIPHTYADANLPNESFDVVISISTIEHIREDELQDLFEDVSRVLVPGGRFIMTVDLFLDLAPFTNKQSNEWGINVNLADLVRRSGLDLVVGNKEELFGDEQFDVERVLAEKNNMVVGNDYPVMVQAIVLQKPNL